MAPAAPPYRSWSFRSLPRDPTFDEERTFRELIRSALRVAAGFRCGFELRWRSGPAGGVQLRVADPGAAEWFRESVGAGYATGNWSLDLAGRERFEPSARFGLLAAGNHLPLPFSVDRPPWSDTVLRGLGAGPPGVTIAWSARPGESAAPRRSPIEPQEGSGLPSTPTVRWPPPTSVERRLHDAIDERRSSPQWAVRLELRAASGVPEPDRDRVAGLVEASTRLEGGNGIRFVRPIPALRSRARWLLLTEPELVGLFPSPWVRASLGFFRSDAPDGIPLGRSAQGRWVRAPVESDQGRHLLILGETGMGKSSLLVRLLLAAVRRGAVVLLDPVGDTGRQLLGALDRSQAARTTWISPNDSPIGLNALAGLAPNDPTGRERADRSLHELVTALRRARSQRYADGGFWGPRIEEVLTRTLALAARLPGGTLVEAHELLSTERALPFDVPSELRGPVHALRELVDQRADEVAGSRRVLGEIARSRVLRRMLCDPTARFQLSEAARPGSITVITGEAPLVGESAARCLLAVHLALLGSEILGRTEATKVFLGLDEAQWYAHDGLAQLLRLGRRANVHVWTATQALRSLGEELHEAVLTNSADLVLFRGDPEEARGFTRWSRELTVERLMALPRGGAAALVGKGNAVEWILSPAGRVDATTSIARRAQIRRESLLRWGRSDVPGGPEFMADPAPSEDGPDRRPEDPTRLAFALRFLAEWVARLGPTEPVVIRLRALRELLGLDNESGRRLGSELRRRRLLEVTTSTREGTEWILARAGWESALSSALTPAEEARLRACLNDPNLPDIRRGVTN